MPQAVEADPWSYHPTNGFFDEAGLPGSRRPAWERLFGKLAEMGPTEFDRRWQQGRRLIHENGVTYNVYTDAPGISRDWQLDGVPLMLDADEWALIERAIQQRATLLSRILADLYGPQQLLASSALPPELLLSNPDYLAPARHIAPPGNLPLVLYAADLARSPTGAWWVINDRTQGPAGTGYALENRLALNRALPEVFRDCDVRRLAGFFNDVRSALHHTAPGPREQPTVVLLTPGAFHEAYFEHAFLARYLGYPLVEPSDLTVRDNVVWLKTLDGLQRVDVIIRRLDDAFCDPLELREDSVLGIPGLTSAARAGNVALANPLGSGLVESPAFMAFLPGLCQSLLNEALTMPSVATWWCGDDGPRQYVIDHLHELVIGPAYRDPQTPTVFGESLTREQRAELLRKIEHEPQRFIAQERVQLSTAPAWSDGKLVPQHMMLRVFAVARADGSFSVMPGGLVRTSASADSSSVGLQSGGGSKDVWVIAGDAAPGNAQQLPVQPPAVLTRQGFALPSRLADNLYWLGRYGERVEGALRLVRCGLQLLSDDSEFDDTAELPWIIHTLADAGRWPADPQQIDLDVAPHLLGRVLFDPDNIGSVRLDVQRLTRVASIIRDRLSLEAWQILSRLDDLFDIPPTTRVDAAIARTNDALVNLAAFTGLSAEGMTHDKGWRLLDIGRRIERAYHLLALLRRSMVDTDENEPVRMQALLEVVNNAMTYRSRYRTLLQPAPVLDLLLLDESNPRSLAHQLMIIEKHVARLSNADAQASRPPEQRVALRALTAVQLAQIDDLVATPTAGHRKPLANLIERTRADLNDLARTIADAYFTHVLPAQHLGGSARAKEAT